MQLFHKYKKDFLPIINHYYVKKIHFIGIGGMGMCGIATILLYQGYYITGSDIVENDAVRYLLRLGINIFFGHCDKNINKADIVVISSAIDLDNNPEVQAAKYENIPIMKRSEVLSELMRYKYSMVISGTHGKTTTTAMLTNICIEAGLNPTFINGGIIKSEGVQARLGYSQYFIAEADESDKSFLWLYPTVIIITNIDVDHMSTYHQNFEFLKEAFIKFLNNLPMYGYAVVCIDDLTIRNIISNIHRKIITYGFSRDANLYILNYTQFMGKSNFTVLIKNKKKIQITLNAPGPHNVLNAAAAIAVSNEEGVRDVNIIRAMLNFKGVSRRFENLGSYTLNGINGQDGEIMLIDDYGHHPTELNATIMTIRSGWPGNRLIMVFQPHRFTRTYDLYNDFICVLSSVDMLLMLDIYPSGEKPIININSKALCHSIYEYGKIKPIFIPNEQFLLKILLSCLQDKDIILIQGAGSIGEIMRNLFFKNNKFLNS